MDEVGFEVASVFFVGLLVGMYASGVGFIDTNVDDVGF